MSRRVGMMKRFGAVQVISRGWWSLSQCGRIGMMGMSWCKDVSASCISPNPHPLKFLAHTPFYSPAYFPLKISLPFFPLIAKLALLCMACCDFWALEREKLDRGFNWLIDTNCLVKLRMIPISAFHIDTSFDHELGIIDSEPLTFCMFRITQARNCS